MIINNFSYKELPLLASIPPTANNVPTVAFLGFVLPDWSRGLRSGNRWYFNASITNSCAILWSLKISLLSILSAINCFNLLVNPQYSFAKQRD